MCLLNTAINAIYYARHIKIFQIRYDNPSTLHGNTLRHKGITLNYLYNEIKYTVIFVQKNAYQDAYEGEHLHVHLSIRMHIRTHTRENTTCVLKYYNSYHDSYQSEHLDIFEVGYFNKYIFCMSHDLHCNTSMHIHTLVFSLL